MVLIRTLLMGLLVLGLAASPQAAAHENHQKAKFRAASPARGAAVPPSEMQQQMEAHMKRMEAEESKTFLERLMSWFGRMHPFAVHFPIALFPVALVSLILARKRG